MIINNIVFVIEWIIKKVIVVEVYFCFELGYLLVIIKWNDLSIIE